MRAFQKVSTTVHAQGDTITAECTIEDVQTTRVIRPSVMPGKSSEDPSYDPPLKKFAVNFTFN